MERRFDERGISGAVRFIEAVDARVEGPPTDASRYAAGQGCTASHLKAMQAILDDPDGAKLGGIVFEDDVLLHEDFANDVEECLANLPTGVPVCLLGYLLAAGFPDLIWAGRDPSKRNLCRSVPGYLWGMHAYWVSPDHARDALDLYGGLDVPDLPTMSETLTDVPGAFCAWPALALQDMLDSEFRGMEETERTHIPGQTRWRLESYHSEAEPPIRLKTYTEPTIGLCMIVKDEAEVIERCLDSVEGLIDTWTICDTGSTDGTQAIVEKRLAGTPGTLHETQWRDFGHNRSELLRLAKGTADYLLLVDADMTVDWRGPLPELHDDAYLLRHDGDLGYWIPRLVRGDRDWHFEGATHEYLACEGDHSEEQLRALLIEHHADGGTRDEKFERDRRLLEAELERDPGNDRATFYLAQTYRDMGETEKAIELYRRRVEIGGWPEEVFYAALQVADLTAREDPRAAIPLYLEAHELRPQRAEAIHQAAYACRRLGWHHTAYALAKRAHEIPEPDDVLFVARDTYRWGALFEFALAAHEIEQHDEALGLYERLLDGRDLPKGIEVSVQENSRRIANIQGGKVPDRPARRALAVQPCAKHADRRGEAYGRTRVAPVQPLDRRRRRRLPHDRAHVELQAPRRLLHAPRRDRRDPDDQLHDPPRW